jgi:hypothetical protein
MITREEIPMHKVHVDTLHSPFINYFILIAGVSRKAHAEPPG